MRKCILIFLFLLPNIIFGQSQILNGIELNGPKGFVKTDNLTWMKGNDMISVQSIKGVEYTEKEYEEICKEGSRKTEFFSIQPFEFSGVEYQVCLQTGENDMIIGQVPIYRDGYLYIVVVGTYQFDYEESNRLQESLNQVGFLIGYMISIVMLN